jgi:hypothetical protein
MQVMVALIPPRSRSQGMLTSLFLERIFHPFSPIILVYSFTLPHSFSLILSPRSAGV